MTASSSLVMTGPNFQQVFTENLQLTIPGDPQSLAASLGNIISGVAPNCVPMTGIVAHAGGGQTSATALTVYMNEVGTVVTAADSVKLPLAVNGLELILSNSAANSMQVFGSGTDTINGVATATGVAQAGGICALYICTKSAPAGTWRRIQSS
jgi:hypothetical protein